MRLFLITYAAFISFQNFRPSRKKKLWNIYVELLEPKAINGWLRKISCLLIVRLMGAKVKGIFW